MYLPFINDKDLVAAVDKVLAAMKKANEKAEKNMYSNVIDPFSAIFDGVFQNLKLEDWLKLEKTRQIQKSMQNSIGDFHQDVIGHVHGWENLGTGGFLDVENKKKKIVAEIKNKYNTTKGDHKVKIYESLYYFLKNKGGYIAYYVEIIPKGKKSYDKPFTPPNNQTHQKMAPNERIRIIDGKSFYALVTGYPDALKDLYLVLPKIICERLKKDIDSKICLEYFTCLFNRVYQF